MSEPAAPQSLNVSLNLVAVRDIVNLGIRRAVAFIGVGLRRDSAPLPTSLVLNEKFELRWFPEPLPQDVAGEIVQEYNAWLTGSALKELDQYFAQYLDEVWHLLRLAQFHGKPLPVGFGPDKNFLNNTNVSSKLTEVADTLELELPDFSSFSRLGLARNALTHNRGVVRDRDTTEPGKLVMQWRTPTIVIKSDEGETLIDPEVQELPGPVPAGASVAFRMAAHEKTFSVGERILLTGYDISAIVYSYSVMADTVMQAVQAHLNKMGIVALETLATTETAPAETLPV